MRVCVVAPHFLGHLIPSVNAAQALLSGGFTVTFISSRSVSSIFEPQILSSGGRCLPSDDGLSESARDLFDINELLSSGLHKIQTAHIRILEEVLVTDGIDAILADSYLHEVHSFAISKGIPLAVLFQSTFQSMSSTYLGVPCETVQIGPGFLYSHPLILHVLARFVEFFKFYKAGVEAVRGKAILLYTSFTGLEPAAFLPPAVHLIGPLLPKADATIDDQGLKRFLESHNSVVLVSVGSILRLRQHQLDTLLEGFRKEKLASVWTIQEGVLPAADDVFVSKWIPQFQCLSHPSVKFFVSHCGLGGVLEAVRTGKPVLCLPFFGDAHENAELIVRANAGLYLHKTSRSETATLDKAQQYFAKSRFSAQEVAEKAKLLIEEDGKYVKGMARLQNLAEAIDSRGELCRQIKRLVKVGDVSHLYPVQKKVTGWIVPALVIFVISLLYAVRRAR
jgi:UDP:flavonoid glycosyltransferase YjiC (YdhE family)